MIPFFNDFEKHVSFNFLMSVFMTKSRFLPYFIRACVRQELIEIFIWLISTLDAF